nr:S-iamide peptide (AKSGFVRIamide) [Perinereis vancaurica]
AKSGFVRI